MTTPLTAPVRDAARAMVHAAHAVPDVTHLPLVSAAVAGHDTDQGSAIRAIYALIGEVHLLMGFDGAGATTVLSGYATEHLCRATQLVFRTLRGAREFGVTTRLVDARRTPCLHVVVTGVTTEELDEVLGSDLAEELMVLLTLVPLRVEWMVVTEPVIYRRFTA